MMKLSKPISAVLFGLGCALTFIGLIALILPAVDNAQLQLVLASFEAPSDNLLVRWMNSGMSFALHNGWKVLIGGIVLLVAGLILLIVFIREPQPQPQHDPYRRPDPPREPLWEAPAAQPEYQPNPFADMALWDHQFAPKKTPHTEHSFASFGGPMLEPNRIDDPPAYTFAADPHARPAAEAVSEEKAPVFSAPPAPPVPQAPAPRPDFPPLQLKAPLMPAKTVAAAFTPPPSLETAPASKPEPVYTPNEEPDEPAEISSRIRSTIGKHRQ